MPDLHNYGEEDYNPLADFTNGENFTTPFDTYLKTEFAKGADFNLLNSGANAADLNRLNNETEQYDPTTLEPRQNFWLSADEAQKKYGIRVHSGQKISDLAAQRIADLKSQAQTREDIINHAQPGFFGGIAGWGAETAATLMDPLSIGSMFVPVVGEARAAMLMERFGPTVGRLIVGGAEGAVGNAILEPFRYGFSQQLDQDYSVYDSFLNIAAGGIIGAGLHAGFGKLGDLLGISEWSKRVESGDINPEAHNQMLKTAVGQALQDQRVQVSPILRLAMERDVPSLDAISQVRMIKSAKDSAAVFQQAFDHQDFINNHYQSIRALLSDAEKQVLDATSTKDIVEGQVQLGSDINRLSTRLEELQKTIEQAHPASRTSISREMGQISDEITQKQSILDNLMETRKLVDEELGKVNTNIDQLVQARSSIDPNTTDPNMVLNIERQQDDALKNIDFNQVKGEADKALLRQAVLKAQDLNKLDSVTPDELVDLATHQGSLSSKWYYSPEGAAQIEEGAKLAPKEDFYVDTEAQKALDEVLSRVNPEDLPDMEDLDHNIALSKRLGNAFKSAASCIIQEIL